MNFASSYHPDPVRIREKIQTLMSLSMRELEKIGEGNRRRYLEMKADFYANFERLLQVGT